VNRRHFSQILLGSLAGSANLLAAQTSTAKPPRSGAESSKGSSGRNGRLFPTDLPGNEWTTFPASGFSQPACGVIYRRQKAPQNGMPLGAIDTGRIDLQPNGTFGFCTAFNSVVPQRGPLNVPFLGMSVGDQKWLFCQPPGTTGEYMFAGIQTPSEIHYWGHYPVADMEFDMLGSPVEAGLRCWAPFLPGDAKASNTPGGVFDVHLTNVTKERQSGRLVFSFPGPTQGEAQITADSPREKVPYRVFGHTWLPVVKEEVTPKREVVRGKFSGLVVSSDQGVGYALGVVGDSEVQTGAGLNSDNAPYTSGHAWSMSANGLPKPQDHDLSGSVSVSFELAPGETKVVSFVLAWYAPMWIGEGPHTFMHMYATRFANAGEVADLLAREHDVLLRRVLAWQEVVYSAEFMPVWLRESLINILYLFPINSFWAAARPPVGPWCRPEDGLFGLLDGIIEDPAIEPIPDTFYANAPLVYFFPDLAVSTLRGYKAYQFASGAAVWIWGGVVGAAVGGYERTAGTEMATPTPGYQTTTNGPCYVDMIDRYVQRTGDRSVLKEFYDSAKRNTIYTMQLRSEDGADGIISVPRGNVDPERPDAPPGFHLEWFESVLWFGMTSHVGGIHLANLEMMERMARAVGDEEFARQCRSWFEQGSHSMESKLWNGDYYLAYFDEKLGKKSDDVFAYQLDGEWMARFHGLPGVFRSDRVKTALAAIKRACIDRWKYGAVNLARPNGDLSPNVGYGPNAFFVPEVYMLAMTYIYAGEREFGLELSRRCVYSLNIHNLLTWNQPNLLRADTGDLLFGSHYVQNMMLWAVPAALEGKDVVSFCSQNSLVERIMRAARTGSAK
jgi:non-lysosomal glucosylceramidase